MNFTHLIVSRINIRWTEHSKDEKWLNNRKTILNNTLRASIQAQTNKNFKFVTLWGYEPEGMIENEYTIKTEEVGLENIFNDIVPELYKLIDEDYVLVTRIDSDNCLSDDFVDILQKNIIEEAPYYYDIKKMNIFNLLTNEKRIWNVSKTSGFISVMEKKEDFICIPYKYNHSKLGEVYSGVVIDDLKVLLNVHEDNVKVKMIGIPANYDIDKFNLKL
jgi:hypothetical protein